jgi:ferredoxin--NADP+ reductase
VPHVVTQACCGDASCVFACPVNAIHPNPDDPDFLTAEMLYIDPVSCVDCGACVGACPVGAIVPDGRLEDAQLPFVDINAMFHRDPRPRPIQAPVPPVVRIESAEPLRVAIVGSGPAALYAADELLKQRGVEVNVIDRLPTPYGLVRAGVAPDHQETKSITGLFRQIEDQSGFGYVLGVEVGSDITHDELLGHHHAVIYATGASQDRTLGIPGEDLPGSSTATDFVAWYNGHPDHAGDAYDLRHERAVIVGNGNVALDVARILATDPADLESTDIADHALEALRRSRIREVVILARRGVAQAAYTLPELTGLLGRADIEVVVEDAEPGADQDPTVAQKVAAVQGLPTSDLPRGDRRRIVLRYLTSPTRILGDDRVTAVEIVRNTLVADGEAVRAVPTDRTDSIDTGLVLRSIGYRGRPVAGLPFGDSDGVIPNEGGRVLGVPRTYVAGWIKRGPTGFIGTNKTCAHETVNHLLEDFNAGLLPPPEGSRSGFADLVANRCPEPNDLLRWRRIDGIERARGAVAGRPRVKLTDFSELELPASGSARRRVRTFARRSVASRD